MRHATHLGIDAEGGIQVLLRALVPDGRVYVHAKDMALSGRQLTPVIYGAILHALGIDPAALTDPAAALAALTAAAGDGGPFNVPEVPGAACYARVFTAHVPGPDGSTVPFDFIINSGFYLTAEELRQEFVEGAVGECVAEDFPDLGQTVTLEWRQNSQNFVITDVE